MTTISVNGIQVRIFWSGAVKIATRSKARSKAIMRYLRAEGFLENKYLDSLA